jgi:hypothetical protein
MDIQALDHSEMYYSVIRPVILRSNASGSFHIVGGAVSRRFVCRREGSCNCSGSGFKPLFDEPFLGIYNRLTDHRLMLRLE